MTLSTGQPLFYAARIGFIRSVDLRSTKGVSAQTIGVTAGADTAAPLAGFQVDRSTSSQSHMWLQPAGGHSRI